MNFLLFHISTILNVKKILSLSLQTLFLLPCIGWNFIFLWAPSFIFISNLLKKLNKICGVPNYLQKASSLHHSLKISQLSISNCQSNVLYFQNIRKRNSSHFQILTIASCFPLLSHSFGWQQNFIDHDDVESFKFETW